MKMTKAEEIRICREKWEASGRKTRIQKRMYLTAEMQEAQRIELEADELWQKAADTTDEMLAKAYKKQAQRLWHRATVLQREALKIATKALAE